MSLSCAFVGILPLVPDRFRQDIESIQSLIFGLTLFDGPDEVVFCFRVKEE